MRSINLNKLPPQARTELVDFYEFLLKKYMPIKKTSSNKKELTKIISSEQLPIGELAVKLFGSDIGIDLNLPKHPAHKPLDFGL